MSTSTLLHQAVRLPARTRRGGKERALMVMEVVLVLVGVALLDLRGRLRNVA